MESGKGKIIQFRPRYQSHGKGIFSVQKLSKENADEEVLLPAAIQHDIARDKEENDDTGEIDYAKLGAKMVESILIETGFEKNMIEEIKYCISPSIQKE